MLEAIDRAKENGIDTVIGYLETHGRKETEALLKEIEIVPRKTSVYKSASIQEMDLDAVLKRSPQLAAVDELAHTNAPDSRHFKRYQDIQELLAAGLRKIRFHDLRHTYQFSFLPKTETSNSSSPNLDMPSSRRPSTVMVTSS